MFARQLLTESRYTYPPPTRPFQRVTGFNFCHSLNHATFFTDTILDLPYSGPSVLSLTNMREFTSLIDYTARKLLEHPDRKEYERHVRVTQEYSDDFAARG